MYMFTHVHKGLWIVLLFGYFRFELYDRNKNFREDPTIIPEPLDVFWPITGYQQLRPEHRRSMPQLTYHQIKKYFLYRIAGKYVNQDLTEMFLIKVIF